jgi:hypothetical protein
MSDGYTRYSGYDTLTLDGSPPLAGDELAAALAAQDAQHKAWKEWRDADEIAELTKILAPMMGQGPAAIAGFLVHGGWIGNGR